MAVHGLSSCSLWVVASSACGILIPRPGELDKGLNPRPLHRKADSLTTGPPGKSPLLRALDIHCLEYSVREDS